MSPLLIILIVVVVLLLLFAAIAIFSGGGDKSAAPDPLAAAPGHDHSAGAANCPACQAAAAAVKKTIPEKCLVLFRPGSDWKGEFGFDWLRQGDTALSGDVDYSTIVGSYGAVYATESTAVFTVNNPKYQSLKTAFYNPFPSSWKKNADNTPYEYFTPWLTLFPADQCTGNQKKAEAKLSLKIEVVAHEPETLRVLYNKEFFTVDKEEVSPKTVGNNTSDITIKCIKEFNTDQEIKIIPLKTGEDQVAGKLMVLKNDKANRYQANIVFVKVQTKINATAKTGSTAGEKAYLEKYFFQSLTSLNLREESLDLKTDAGFNTNYVMAMDPATKAVCTFLADGSMVHAFLENAFNAQVTGYTDWHKIFFFDENGGYLKSGAYAGLNGCARAIPSKSVVLFNGHNTSTTTHELLHAMGLQHSFDNNGQYTYKIGETENIMDYSHQSTYGSKNRIATWKWQWDALRPNLQKE